MMDSVHMMQDLDLLDAGYYGDAHKLCLIESGVGKRWKDIVIRMSPQTITLPGFGLIACIQGEFNPIYVFDERGMSWKIRADQPLRLREDGPGSLITASSKVTIGSQGGYLPAVNKLKAQLIEHAKCPLRFLYTALAIEDRIVEDRGIDAGELGYLGSTASTVSFMMKRGVFIPENVCAFIGGFPRRGLPPWFQCRVLPPEPSRSPQSRSGGSE
jgi:hypothetical protein